MITIEDAPLYQAYRSSSASSGPKDRFFIDLVLPALAFGSIGAITYAIRGTGGWGGFDGGIIPGMAWAWLWYYMMRRKGLDARGIVLWLGLGIAAGAMLGYGQYASWVTGSSGPGSIDTIDPWLGYAWFFIAGVGFSPGGVLLGWALGSTRLSAKTWLARLLVPAGFALLGWVLTLAMPAIFFPGISRCGQAGYDAYCERMVSTNTTNFAFLMWWVGALVVSLLERDKATLACGLIVGIGFGLAQALGGAVYSLWMLAPDFMDWWKAWELTTGFIGGVSCALALYWVQRHVDKITASDGHVIEDEGAVLLAENGTKAADGHRGAAVVTSLLALLSLLLVAWYGSTYYLGIDLSLYTEVDIAQNDFLPARIVLITIGTVTILAGFTWRLARHVKNKKAGIQMQLKARDLYRYLIYLVLYLFIIGIYTIWEMRIAMLYAVHFGIALIVLDRIDEHAGSFQRGTGALGTSG